MALEPKSHCDSRTPMTGVAQSRVSVSPASMKELADPFSPSPPRGGGLYFRLPEFSGLRSQSLASAVSGASRCTGRTGRCLNISYDRNCQEWNVNLPESQPMAYLHSCARVTCHATTFQFSFCLTQTTVLRRSIGLNVCPLSDPLKGHRQLVRSG